MCSITAKETCMIINLRGTSGSGKSTIFREVMEQIGCVETLRSSAGKIQGYLLNGNVRVVGRYETACGGCDALPRPKGFNTMDSIEELVREWAPLGHVLFEGLIVSSVFSRWLRLSQELGKGAFVWAFLDTPLEVCIQRVYQRNGGKPFKHSKLEAKHSDCQRQIEKCREQGERVALIDHTKVVEQILELLCV